MYLIHLLTEIIITKKSQNIYLPNMQFLGKYRKYERYIPCPILISQSYNILIKKYYSKTLIVERKPNQYCQLCK